MFFFKETNLKKILLYVVSFAVGALIGDVFIHLLPEAFKNMMRQKQHIHTYLE